MTDFSQVPLEEMSAEGVAIELVDAADILGHPGGAIAVLLTMAAALIRKQAAKIERQRDALQPFVDACAKADKSDDDIRKYGMGHGLSDHSTVGWGIRYMHLKAARAALQQQPKEGQKEK